MATKFLVLILLLVNTVLFGIKLSGEPMPISPAEAAPPSIYRPDLPVISLLSELPAVKLQFLASAQQCFSIGPIHSTSQVEQLKTKLAEFTLESQQRTSQAQVDQGFWVYLDAMESRAKALEFANELGSMGFTDYFVVTSGELDNSISLGLYSDEQNARKRQQSLRALGFNPRIIARYKTVDQFWVDYQLAQGSSSPWNELKSSIPTAVQLELPCSAPPVESENQQMHASN